MRIQQVSSVAICVQDEFCIEAVSFDQGNFCEGNSRLMVEVRSTSAGNIVVTC